MNSIYENEKRFPNTRFIDSNGWLTVCLNSLTVNQIHISRDNDSKLVFHRWDQNN